MRVKGLRRAKIQSMGTELWLGHAPLSCTLRAKTLSTILPVSVSASLAYGPTLHSFWKAHRDRVKCREEKMVRVLIF